MQLNKSESNPMLLGYMELINDERKEMQERQKRLDQEVKSASEIMALMEQQKKEMILLQLQQKQKLNDAMKANPGVSAIMKEIEEGGKTLQEHQQMFEKEMFKAVYMVPVVITPEPEKDERGNIKLAKDSKMQFPALNLPNNKKCLMAFTDSKEFKKWEKSAESSTISLKMYDLGVMVLKDSNLAGVMINPFGTKVLFPREKMEQMAKSSAGKQQSGMKKNVETVEADTYE